MTRQNRRSRLRKTGSITTLTKKPSLVKLNNLNYDPSIFENAMVGNVVDEFFSNKGGVPKACNFIMIGDPGVGKSTVALDIVCDLQRKGSKVLFISAEMNEIDLYEYMERYPKFGEVEILFLADYTDENTTLVIEEVLKKGYDVVLGDSFAEIVDEVKETTSLSSTRAEKWLIDLMVQHNRANNDSKKYTTFLMIQQMTKGGKFVGSNKLKHNTTGMLEIRFDGDSDMAPRYLEFSKNRRGTVGKRLYFTLDTKENVNYLVDKWNMTEENRERLKNELDNLAKEAADFDALLRLDDATVEDTAEVAV